ncbi:MAG: UDP-3-O-(3-hydroxymyristoyl)glucosamine N-acyltransferase [Bacteroidetes bacterium]|nr:UDP-3-O-(3-hydroxymyristoyl)glucosamine N-acyltransferase [Bacteroidota bacterium]
MEISARQIAEILNGTIEGDPDVKVNHLSKIEEGVEGSISFLSNPLYTHYIYSTQASITIVNNDFYPTQPISSTLIKVEKAEMAFAKLLEFYNQIKNNKSGISEKCTISKSAKIGTNLYIGDFTFIGDNAKIGDNVKIYPQVYIGDNSVIGDNTTIFAGVKIYSDNLIGKDCIIHAGTIIGSDGFRFAPQNGENLKIAQIGNVIIEDDVEIGANCAIDRATLGSTIIRKGVKFDNLIHIAHNVEVGEYSFIAANSIIAGSTKIGKNCMLAGQVGIIGHLTIADGTIIAAQSGISKSIKKTNETFMGSPAFEINDYRKSYIHFKNFSKILERLDKLEKELNQRNS